MALPKRINNDLNLIISDFEQSRNFDKALADIRKTILYGDPKPRTQATRFSLVKKRMKNITDNSKFINAIKPDDALTRDLLKQNLDIRNNKTVLGITRDKIELLKSFQNSTDPYKLAMYLLFMSGRRTSELLNGEFTLSDEKGFVNLDGFKKTRGHDSKGQFKTISFPKKFLRLLKKFQKMNVSKTTFACIINRRIKTILGEEYTAHSLRSAYAAYRFKFDNAEKKIINKFIQEALNHLSMDSSISYMGHGIAFEKPVKGI